MNAVLRNYGTLALAAFGIWIAYSLSDVFTPFFVAAFLAYLFNPLVRLLSSRYLSRTAAVVLVFAIIIAILWITLAILLPMLAQQLTIFINKLPNLATWFQQKVRPGLLQHFGIDFAFDALALKGMVGNHWQQASQVAVAAWKTISYSGLMVISRLVQLILVPVLAFYLLRDWKLVLRTCLRLVPRRYKQSVVQFANEADSVLAAFFRGQLLVMVAVGTLYTFGLWGIGLDVALLIGSLAGLASIIPYFGFVFGVLSGCIAAAIQFQDLIHVLYVVAVFSVVHLIENSMLTPYLVGDRIGLHPVAVLFAIMAGGHLGGFFGVVLALPGAAVLMILLRHGFRRYVQSYYYRRLT